MINIILKSAIMIGTGICLGVIGNYFSAKGDVEERYDSQENDDVVVIDKDGEEIVIDADNKEEHDEQDKEVIHNASKFVTTFTSMFRIPQYFLHASVAAWILSFIMNTPYITMFSLLVMFMGYRDFENGVLQYFYIRPRNKEVMEGGI